MVYPPKRDVFKRFSKQFFSSTVLGMNIATDDTDCANLNNHLKRNFTKNRITNIDLGLNYNVIGNKWKQIACMTGAL